MRKIVNPTFSELNQLIRKFSAESYNSIAITPLTLATWLCLGGAFGLVYSVIAPEITQAHTTVVEVSIDHQAGENYETLLRRAEAVAKAAAQQSFHGDSLVSEVAVTVLGKHQGSIAPVLSLKVSRQLWSSRPDPQRWATYFPSAKSLLRFDNTVVKAPAPTQPTPPTSFKAPSRRVFIY